MQLAVSFNNLGPYHLARLRALQHALAARGDSLLAIETAGCERKYPWLPPRNDEPFESITLFPDTPLEDLSPGVCSARMLEVLEARRPSAIAACGYVRPESLAALKWANRRRVPCILMSESQAIDRPRVWWKEAVKRSRVRRFDAALVGGPTHRDYLVDLGMPPDRIALGYNAVDHDFFESASRQVPRPGHGRPYFLSVCRFVPEKNLSTLLDAYARYRGLTTDPWDLVLCGAGPEETALHRQAERDQIGHALHWPGFLQAEALVPYYSSAGAFVLPSLSEPWGLVANEAAACGLPLLLSNEAGCALTLAPDPPGTAGFRFDSSSPGELTSLLLLLSRIPEPERRAMGERARNIAATWGPARFASGMLAALHLAARPTGSRRSIARQEARR